MASRHQIRFPLGSTGLTCSPLGFGGYRIHDGHSGHEKALRAYLDHGGNLMDTSANYGDGLSEVLIGRVMKSYDRANLIVVTKGGYIQGQNMTLARARHFPEVVAYADELWHCIHPEFLEMQIRLSLKRLQQEDCDIYLLHNPEYYMNHAARTSPITNQVLDEFYRRIREAFLFLESQVEKGRIRFYGISSNNFGYHEKDRARVSVARCLEEAQKISADHHFKVIQLPMNLYEAGGALYESNENKTVLKFCQAHGIGVLLNRPLNAFFQNKLIRLADYVKPGQEKQEFKKIFESLRESEKIYSEQFGGELCGPEQEGVAAYLHDVAAGVPSREFWPQVMDQYVIPPVTDWLRRRTEEFGNDHRWPAWQKNFVMVINETLESIEKHLSIKEQAVSDRVREKLVRSGYPESKDSLSRVVLSLLVQLEGVSSVLCGMRSAGYVEDAMAAPQMPVVEALSILKTFQENINA